MKIERLIADASRKEKAHRVIYDNWKQEPEWQDNPKIALGIALLPGEWVRRKIENDGPCPYCFKVCYIYPAKLCEGFTKIVYPRCSFCKKPKQRCGCALGSIQKYFDSRGE